MDAHEHQDEVLRARLELLQHQKERRMVNQLPDNLMERVRQMQPLSLTWSPRVGAIFCMVVCA